MAYELCYQRQTKDLLYALMGTANNKEPDLAEEHSNKANSFCSVLAVVSATTTESVRQ